MSRVVDVEINKVNALITLGSMYRNAAEAIKEYVSNALDEWALARRAGRVEGPCRIHFTLSKGSITIDYNAPGMTEQGFESALKSVVDSPKQRYDVPQIGHMGIGIWAFNQIGGDVTFLSKRDKSSPTVQVKLRRHSAQAEISSPSRGGERAEPGMTIIITDLFQDPTKRYGPLSPARLKHVLADRFDAYLRSGHLEIKLQCGKEEQRVEAHHLDPPEIGEKYREVPLRSDPDKVFQTRFWFDPSGNGRVSIRHTGVVVIDDLRSGPEYNLDDTVYVSGYLKGFIDADFVTPLPARAQFLENLDLIDFFDSLRSIAGGLEEEMGVHHEEAENERRQGLFRRATKIAREVLSQEEFLDLELIEGLTRLRRQATEENTAKVMDQARTESNGSNGPNGTSHTNGNGTRRASRPILRQAVFETDPLRRSMVSQGAIEINITNPDFKALSELPRNQQVAYVAMLLGKEVIAYNDASGVSEEALEKMVAYGTRVLSQVWH